MSEPTIDDIAARHAAATRGPWRWFGSLDTQDIYLATVNRGRIYVMGFQRWGMRNAQPVFGERGPDAAGIMVPVKEIPVFEVCPACTDPTDRRVYRKDLVALRNPDAELIAHSWEDIDVLLRRVRALEAELAAAREVCHEPLS